MIVPVVVIGLAISPETAVYWACDRDRADMVKSLAVYGADVNARSERDSTPLIDACRVGHLGAVRALLESGASVNLPFSPYRPYFGGHSIDLADMQTTVPLWAYFSLFLLPQN